MAKVTPRACIAIFDIVMDFALLMELLKYHEISSFHYKIIQLTVLSCVFVLGATAPLAYIRSVTLRSDEMKSTLTI
jgi:hypothetical protein